jgi:hypothetical protein
VKLCDFVGYSNAGTVEFLVEPATGKMVLSSSLPFYKKNFTPDVTFAEMKTQPLPLIESCQL